MKKNNYAYIIVTLTFVLILGAGFSRGIISEYREFSSEVGDINNIVLEDFIDTESLKKNFGSGPWNKHTLIDLNGYIAKTIGVKDYYGNEGIYVSDNGYIVGIYPESSTDYEFNQVVAFKKFCDENDIKLLYVNEPIKYTEDQEITEEFGLETFSNRNADKLIARLRNAGVPVVDIRDSIKQDGINPYSLFYKTDHHWTTRATLWATPVVMKGLNDYCGYDIDLSIYDTNNYIMKDLKACWLGEQGRKIGAAYVGLDDFTIIETNYPTSYSFKTDDGAVKGSFDGFINDKRFNLDKSVYNTPSWHYAYCERDCINNTVSDGKVLLIGDSYARTAEPFMSLSVHEMDTIIRRDMAEDFDLRQYVLDRGYDSVIIQYAQLMIGAHDDIDSDNYLMFKLD